MGLFAKARQAPSYKYHPQTFKSLESFNHDGFEVARRRRDARARVPLRQIVYFAVAVLSFKVFLFLQMGAATYGAKTEELLAAPGIERFAGYVMQMDPVTQWIVDRLRFGFLG